MKLSADNQWHEDDSMRASGLFVGMARNGDTGENLGVAIALEAELPGGRKIQVSSVMSVEQSMEVADAIREVALEAVVGGE